METAFGTAFGVALCFDVEVAGASNVRPELGAVLGSRLGAVLGTVTGTACGIVLCSDAVVA